MKVVVLGAGGGLGKVVVKYFKDIFEVEGFTRKQIDVTSIKSLNKLPKGIDLLINCAGYFGEDNEKKLMDVNYNGVWNVTMVASCDKMNKNGEIFHITSSAGIRPNKEFPLYSQSKKYANTHIKMIGSLCLRMYEVYVNGIAPCRIRTPMRKKIVGNKWKTEEALEPEEVAEFIYDLFCANLRLYGNIFDLKMRYKQ